MTTIPISSSSQSSSSPSPTTTGKDNATKSNDESPAETSGKQLLHCTA